MLGVVVTYTPRLTAAEQQLAALPGRLRNLASLMTLAIAPAAEQMLQRHWSSQGAAFGHPWAAWAPSTLAERTRKGNVAQGILRDTNHLFRALFRALANAGQRLTSIAGGGVRLALGLTAADDPIEALIAGFLQRGTRRMPARQIVPSPLPRSFRDQVRALVHDFIATGQLRGVGGRFVAASAS